MSDSPRRTSGDFAAVVLAAGLSQRMGVVKALLPVAGRPMIARVLDSIVASGAVTQMVLVTGHAAGEVTAATRGYDVRAVHNPEFETGGMLSSVKTGVAGVGEDVRGFFIFLGDQPMLRPQTIADVAQAQCRSDAPVVLPNYRKKRGHPVLFAQRCKGEIMGLDRAATLRDVVAAHEADLVEIDVEDPAVTTDVDTPEDYQKLLQLFKSRS